MTRKLEQITEDDAERLVESMKARYIPTEQDTQAYILYQNKIWIKHKGKYSLLHIDQIDMEDR